MAPSAITPPAIEAKRPSLSRVDTSSLGTSRKLIIFSDFDGTIFMQDTGHALFDNFGCGAKQRQNLAKQMESGERTFREVSDELYASLDVPFENGFEVMKTALDIDPDFQDFHEFCVNNKIPFNVISAGLKPVLRRVLDHFIGEEMSSHIDIVANDARITDGKWEAVWRHDNDLGHDKAKSLNDFKDEQRLKSENGTIPMIIFVGDGLSDLPAAREADVLFARRGLRLEEYCAENEIQYHPFDTFADIQTKLIEIAKMDEAITSGHGTPSVYNPRANMWRRASSKAALPVFHLMSPKAEEKAFVWPEQLTKLTTPVSAVPKTAVAAPVA